MNWTANVRGSIALVGPLATGLVAMAALLLLYAAFDDLGRQPASVHIVGARDQPSRERVQHLVSRHVARATPGQGLGELRAALEEESWVRQARVEWRWPRRLLVQVTEETPVARWGSEGLLDTGGNVMERPAGAGSVVLPELQGPPGSGPTMKDHYRLASDMLAPLGLGVVGMRLDPAGDWTVRLDNTVELRLGRHDFAPRLRRFVAVWHGSLGSDAQRVAHVDARYGNGVAVGWREQVVGR